MEKVVAFIDGFNLYHAIDDLKRPHLKWVNLWDLVEALVRPQSQVLEEVYYFSAYATWLPGPMIRHRAYVRALRSVGVNVVLGKFKPKDRRCPKCDHAWKSHEEKETDVNIALAMLMQGVLGAYDHAFLISQDSDLAPAIRLVTRELEKPVTVVTPPHRKHSTELIGAATAKAKITLPQIERSLFPQQVHDAGGNVVATRPTDYTPPLATPP